MALKQSSVSYLQARSNSRWIGESLRRAIDYHQKGDLLKAEGAYREVLAGPANRFEALHLLGVVMLQTGRAAGGLELIDKALAICPNDVDALNNRGNGLKDLKRFKEALASYDQALAIKPDYAEALSNRGNALKSLNRLEEALASYDKALAIKPNYVDALNNRGAALKHLGRHEEALASYEKALELQPDNFDALNNRGNALAQLKRLAEALRQLRQGADDQTQLRRRDLQSRAYRIAPGRLRRRMARLRKPLGQKRSRAAETEAAYRTWRGENLSGKRIIVFEEQGLGDIIQFSRYLKQLATAGADVTFVLRPGMRRLIATLDGTVRLTDSNTIDEKFDYQCPLLSLPLAFGTNLDNIPSGDALSQRRSRAHPEMAGTESAVRGSRSASPGGETSRAPTKSVVSSIPPISWACRGYPMSG